MGGRLRWNSQWLDALPENLADNPTADRLRTICEPDLSELASAEPPQGYGRLSLLLQASTRSDLTPNAVDRKPPIQAISQHPDPHACGAPRDLADRPCRPRRRG